MRASLSKQVRISFLAYFEGWSYEDGGIDPYRIVNFGIIKFSVKPQKGKKLIISIHLERPGLLIGKHGKRINALQKYLTERFDRDVHIELIEKHIFH